MTKQSHPATEAFIERMGLSTEADGLPRIAGRMWGFFLIHGGPCSFAELAKRLQVSRGSISTNARILRDLGIIERVARPGDRQDYYQLADNPYHRLLEGYVERMRGTLRSIEQVLNELPEEAQEWAGTHARLNEMHRFHTVAVETTVQLLRDLECDSADQPQARATSGR